MEAWKHPLCGCFSNCGLAVTALFCPCLVFGDVASWVGESKGTSACCLLVPGVNVWAFQNIRHKLRISLDIAGSTGDDVLMGLFCMYCATVQMASEAQEVLDGGTKQEITRE